ncbi:MAG TPA: arsenite methyltransferase [Anaerolineae bacterium]|nr:arsenite methyltransferase [Anaerolineae bacterium]
MSDTKVDEEIKTAVRQAYGDIARRFVDEPAAGEVQASCCSPSEANVKERGSETAGRMSCCGSSATVIDEPGVRIETQKSCCGSSEGDVESAGAARFYSLEELGGLPESVTGASLGCGNPIAISELKAGEVVLDLGSGGGIDCFLAARKVGPEGRVIGLDMTPDMIKLARRNAKEIGATNVEFRWGEMEEIPLPGESVDVVISNCVINLSPDKDAVFGEAYRVLRPGGRMNVSDIVVDGQLPQLIRDSLNAWAGCIAGALDESDYLGKIRRAGFEEVEVLSREFTEIDEATEWDDVQVMIVGADGEVASMEEARAMVSEAGLSPRDLAHKVASIKVRAKKPE